MRDFVTQAQARAQRAKRTRRLVKAVLTVVVLAVLGVVVVSVERSRAEAQKFALETIYADIGVVRPDYKEAFNFAYPLAQRGNHEAQMVVGYMYRHGMGVARSIADAQAWYCKAAKAGYTNASAKFLLGAGYGECGAESRDPAARLAHLEEAARTDRNAMFELGAAYEKGVIVKANGKLATYWYERAAHAGLADAMDMLGYNYANGLDGLPVDPQQAVKWWRAAAKAGDRREAGASLAYLEAAGGLPADPKAAAALVRKASNTPPFLPGTSAQSKARH